MNLCDDPAVQALDAPSRRVYRVTTCRRPRGHDFEANGRGKQRSLQRSAMGFGCRSCGRRIPQLYDRKEHTLATPLDP